MNDDDKQFLIEFSLQAIFIACVVFAACCLVHGLFEWVFHE